MAIPYRPIMSTLGYVLSPDHRRVLMTHRIYRQGDDQFGKYNGIGGHMEPGEDIAAGMIREIQEEAGITPIEMTLRGTVNWTCFGPKGEDWLAFIFLIKAFSGEPALASNEGPLQWIEREKIASLPIWPGDHYFLPLIFDDDPRPFHGYLPYDHETPTGWSYTRM